jgi:2'-5' RNA ligase
MFVAAETTPEIQRKAADLVAEMAATTDAVRWVEPGNLHWTLKFLGEVQELDVAEVCQRVASAAAALPPFMVEVRGAGAFPTPARPRTLWLGVGAGERELVDLQQPIERELEAMGFRPEPRQFVPHLTIGRVRKASRSLQRLADALGRNSELSLGLMEVHEAVVFSSRLSREGPEYTALGRAPLEG